MSRPGKHAAFGMVQLLIILGSGIFLPAETFNYWQAWLFSSVFVTCSVAMTAYLWKHDPKLLQRRLRAGPTAEKEPAQKVIAFVAYIGFMALLMVPALDHRFGWSHVPFAIVMAANVLIVVGCYLIFLVFRENSFASATIEIADDHKLISTGPYAIVRHPLYAGAFLWLIGTPLALGSYWGLALTLVMMPVLIWRLLDEERFLAQHLPGYPEYEKRVQTRLIPFVW